MRFSTIVWMAIALAIATILLNKPVVGAEPQEKHGFADSDGVKIHYVTRGTGPLVVLIHGFPDYWYTWREQIPALAEHFQVVAIDQRGYNRSGQPAGVENYSMDKLVGDIGAVVRHFDVKRATIVGHDWGGAVAWTFAMTHPKMTERLVILNLPHPRGLSRELAKNGKQQAASAYARRFQQPDAAKALTAEVLAGWVRDLAAREKYIAAFRRSSFESMLNYYKANYPRTDAEGKYTDSKALMPNVSCSVLMIHGLDDKALLPGALNGTWNWIDSDLTLITVPGAGHFVQQDASSLVTREMVRWLTR